MTGIRRTSSTDTVRVIVEAYHKFTLDSGSGVNEVASVVFTVTESNANSTGHLVTTRSLWKPNDTDVNDPLPVQTGTGAPWGGTGPAPICAFGYEVPMTLTAGTITVEALVTPTQGDTFTLPLLTIYNHKNGRTLTRCAFVNVTLGMDFNSKFETDNHTGGLNHVLLRHITNAGDWFFETDTAFSYSAFEVHDCGFQKTALTGGGSPFAVTASHNHFNDLASYAFGNNVTTSSPTSFWSATNHMTSGDYSASSSLAYASGLWSRPSEYVSSNPPRGAWSNTNRESSQGGW